MSLDPADSHPREVFSKYKLTRGRASGSVARHPPILPWSPCPTYWPCFGSVHGSAYGTFSSSVDPAMTGGSSGLVIDRGVV
jgi:hypothetical protein